MRGVVFCDLPHIPEGYNGKFIVTNLAAVAELKGAAISARTRAALAAARAIGASLGGRRGSADHSPRWHLSRAMREARHSLSLPGFQQPRVLYVCLRHVAGFPVEA